MKRIYWTISILLTLALIGLACTKSEAPPVEEEPVTRFVHLTIVDHLSGEPLDSVYGEVQLAFFEAQKIRPTNGKGEYLAAFEGLEEDWIKTFPKQLWLDRIGYLSALLDSEMLGQASIDSGYCGFCNARLVAQNTAPKGFRYSYRIEMKKRLTVQLVINLKNYPGDRYDMRFYYPLVDPPCPDFNQNQGSSLYSTLSGSSITLLEKSAAPGSFKVEVLDEERNTFCTTEFRVDSFPPSGFARVEVVCGE